MNTKGLMAGILLAILILTTTGAALDFNAAFSTVYGKVTDGGAGVNGANVSLTANGVTITTKTMTNNRGETGFYIFELANIPKVTDTTPLTLSVTVGTKSATTTITKGGSGLQQVDLVPVSTTPVLTTITVTPAAKSVAIGGTQTFSAAPKDQFGNAIAATVTWSISDPSVGNISAAGVFTASAAGTATVSATNGTVIGNATVTVVTPVLTTITVSPLTATVVVGNNRSFGAAALDQLGNSITAAVTWSSSNTTVGTINSAGLFTANAVGVTTITAASGGVNGTATVTVTAIPPVLASITVSPGSVTVAVGNTQNFTAAPKDQFGNPIDAAVIWSSSNPTVGTISSAGVFTAVSEGTTLVNATNGIVNGSASVTVTAPAGGIVPPSGGSSSGSSGGGGGGGGGTTGESFANIMVKEKYDEAIFKDKVTSYKFKNASNPITHVNVTGNNNAGLITAMIEVLKGTSALVKEVPPGTVIKNINVWLGTSGFATPKNLKEVVIRFRVENSWMQSNNVDAKDVKLLRWDGAKWMTLETKMKEKDATNTFFEATTTSLSPLAISAVASPPGPVAAVPTVVIPPTPEKTKASEPKATPGFGIAAGMAAISVLYVLGRMLYIRRR